uniref:Crystaline entomocidal protoxin n=1 Tax=Bacillus thuringiensis TaxID=1428 RepID=A0A0M3KRL2_BACTU|nr:cry4-like protein [Bacillus thuringiensis]
MNSYENKSEYEILDASPNNKNMPNRYPFAKNPNIFPINLNACQGSPWQDTWESVSYIVTIGAYLIQFLQQPGIGGIPIILSIIDKLIPSSGRSVAALSICDLLSIIRTEIDETTLNRRAADFNGVLAVHKKYYLNSLQEWLDAKQPIDPENQKLKNVVRDFIDADKAFITLIGGGLSENKAQILLLPTYAQAANVHLLLLRDAVQYKEKWGSLLGTEKVGSELISPTMDYNERLKDALAQYTNHCTQWYQAGLNQIREVGTSAENWLKFNKFRREMTLAVLDIISIFPTYDFENYPLETNIELSRIIYTDPVGWTVEGMSTMYPWYSPYNRISFNQLEAEAVRSPYLSTWLDYIDIYSSQYSSSKVWSGNANTMKTIGGVTGRQDGSAAGTPQRINVGNTDIFKIELTAGVHHFFIDYTNPNPLRSYGIISSKFFMTNGSTPTYTGSAGSMFTQTGKVIALPGEKSEIPTANDYTHKLSDVINLTGGLPQHGSNSVRSSLVAHGWTHTSMTKYNRIYPNKITQIPAVKSYSLSGGLTVRHVSDHTGGDVVYFSQVGRVKLLCTFTSPGYYKMRIRYASEYTATMTVNGIPVSLSSTTRDRSNLPYEAFQYAKVGPDHVFAVLTPNTLEFDIYGGINGLTIDKIEFIPVDSTALEYEGKQSLEKAQNVVNGLFVN